jgi:hypothetical protein
MSDTVRFGGSEWLVEFGMGAQRLLGAQVAPEDDTLAWLPAHLLELNAGDVRALSLTLWAGMKGRPDEPADLLDLIDEASPEEYELLGSRLLELLMASLPGKQAEPPESDKPQRPWSWEVAEAVWSTEWAQPADKFETTTLKQFTALSNGRAVLYASATEGGSGEQRLTTAADYEGLLNMGR